MKWGWFLRTLLHPRLYNSHKYLPQNIWNRSRQSIFLQRKENRQEGLQERWLEEQNISCKKLLTGKLPKNMSGLCTIIRRRTTSWDQPGEEAQLLSTAEETRAGHKTTTWESCMSQKMVWWVAKENSFSLTHKTAKFQKEKEPCSWSVINPLIRQILSSISADVIVLRSKRNNFSDTKPNELPMIASDAETGLELVLQKSALDSDTHNRVFRFDQWRVKEEDNLELLQRGHTHTPNPKCLFLGVSNSCFFFLL
jgi:hypothetical protein